MRAGSALLLALAWTAYSAPSPLAVVKPAISDLEDGPVIAPAFAFVPGQFIFLSFQIGGFKASEEQKIHLSYKVDAFDPKGVRLIETVSDKVDTTLAPEDKNWKPLLRQQFLIPPIAPSGTYKITIQVTDDLANGATVSQDIPFNVRSREVSPSDTLVVRNFHFYRSEEDRDPLTVAAYKPGDTLWARFDITGYKFGPRNSVDVDYVVAVLAPGGKVLFQQDKPAEGAADKGSSFYPKAYVPGSMSLNLQNNTRSGQYTIVLTARDHTGKQTAEAKADFSIE
jgi:hypothetical protein